jgi:hypothetical protein
MSSKEKIMNVEYGERENTIKVKIPLHPLIRLFVKNQSVMF